MLIFPLRLDELFDCGKAQSYGSMSVDAFRLSLINNPRKTLSIYANRTTCLAMRSVDYRFDISFAGMFLAAAYFDQDSAKETESRTLADELYRRPDFMAQDTRGDEFMKSSDERLQATGVFHP